MKNYSGRTINQYYLSKDLGQGGMVVVYKAYDNALNHDVVVKMIRTEDLDGTKRADILQRFIPLANTLVRLDHPNIVPVMDHGSFEGIPYLVAEYLPGGTLKQRMRKPLSLKAAIQVLTPITDALIYAHRNGVLHQDFKPSNVLFHNLDKRPMLTDLGIASLFADSTFDLELFELGFGTPAYMAPEQWRGHQTDQSDVYSVGIVFYEMLTGKIANKTETPLAAAFKQNEGFIPDPTEVIRGLSPDVQHFFFKCLALETVNRFQSMEEMKEAIMCLIPPITDSQGIKRETQQPQINEPIAQNREPNPSGYEATRVIPIQEEQTQHVAVNIPHANAKLTQPLVSSPVPIQSDFRPSKSPDYIKPAVVSLPGSSALPPLQLRQKGTRRHKKLSNYGKLNTVFPTLKVNPWTTSLVLALTTGLAHWLGAEISQKMNFFEPGWIPSVIGRTIAWLIMGSAVFCFYRLTTKLKLYPVGLVGFLLAGVIPTLVSQMFPQPFDDWLFEITLWLLLGFGIAVMFHGLEKLKSSESLMLGFGWTFAATLSLLPLILFYMINFQKSEVPNYLYVIQGLILGVILAATIYRGFQRHFKHDRNALAKLVACFSLSCAWSYFIFYNVENDFSLTSAISWSVMTGFFLAGVAWATIRKTTPKAQSQNDAEKSF